jgi:tRNA-Thr(GGU) m(6)t(6)A37 methyltransferase TsaA
MAASREIAIRPIGVVRSTLKSLDDAPKQGSEGAPDAWLEIEPAFAEALAGIGVGDALVVLTWLDRARRDLLKVHPRGDPKNPLTGIFATRAPHRPNPIGLHRVEVREIGSPHRLRVGPLEALDGTPVVDLKPVLEETRDA